MTKESTPTTTGLDRISELPINVTDNILVRLPQKEAMRTSILSSKWRYKWTDLPQLLFDYPQNQKMDDSERTKLTIAIYQALLRHCGPLFKFRLSAPDMGNSPDINHWLHFLKDTDLRDFTLSIWTGKPHKLPGHFYLFRQLRHLSLYNCVFKPPTSFKVLDMLVSLEFRKVVFPAERFGIFLSNCPMLEILTLEDCPHLYCLRIASPNLKYLWFSGSFDSINLKNTPLLQVVSIALLGLPETAKYFKDRKSCNLIEIISNMPAVEELVAERNFFEFLAIGNIQKRLPANLDHLRILRLSDICFWKVEEVSCALCLIRSSPNLEELTVTANTKIDAYVEPDAEHFRVHHFSDCSLNRLREVKILQISCVQPELEFMKFVLATSTTLEKLEILATNRSSNRGFQILKELVKFRRASAKAEIIYTDADHDQLPY